jgi:protein O-GlcNAc transferase
MTTEQVLQTAAEHHDAGRLGEAEKLYRQVLERERDHPDALHYLGLLCFQLDRNAEALDLLDRAIVHETDAPELHAVRARVLTALGSADNAVAAWQKALSLHPDDAAGHAALGVLLSRQGKNDQAIAAFRAAVKLKGDDHSAWYNLAVLLLAAHELEEAAVACRRSLDLQPDRPQTWNTLGSILRAQGNNEQAADAFRRAITFQPDYVEAYCNLAMSLRELNRSDEAFGAASRAVALRPDYGPAQTTLATLLNDRGQTEAALAACRRALELGPERPEDYNNLAILLGELGRADESIELCQKVLATNPGFADAWKSLGSALRARDRFDEAIAAYRKALDLRPRHADALRGLAQVLLGQGQIKEALQCYDEVLSIRADPVVHSLRLFALTLDPSRDAHAILREHREWNNRYARPLAREIRPHRNDRTPDRRLRVGYVSSYVGQSVIGWNLLPLLANHDHEQFEVFCYSAARGRDDLTGRVAAAVDVWRDIARLEDTETAELIRADGIDILVDLNLHTTGNRLLVFARKPAPVQVTYLAYCGTSGMDAMDYRLSDLYFDPPGSDLTCYSEQTALLPHAYWCYEPGGPLPKVGSLPAQTAGRITFGSMNSFAKASLPARDLWAKVLLAAPGSHLLIHAEPGAYLEAVRQRFVEAGVSGDRITFEPHKPWPQYIQTYNRLDIALDTLPYNGGITSCDTLMMGVPVVTLRGRTPVGRAGCSILNNVGLPELIAETAEEYVEIAAKLAGDLPRLAELRSGLRARMDRSPLRDAKGFARDVEAAYRWMWRQWAQKPL